MQVKSIGQQNQGSFTGSQLQDVYPIYPKIITVFHLNQ